MSSAEELLSSAGSKSGSPVPSIPARRPVRKARTLDNSLEFSPKNEETRSPEPGSTNSQEPSVPTHRPIKRSTTDVIDSLVDNTNEELEEMEKLISKHSHRHHPSKSTKEPEIETAPEDVVAEVPTIPQKPTVKKNGSSEKIESPQPTIPQRPARSTSPSKQPLNAPNQNISKNETTNDISIEIPALPLQRPTKRRTSSSETSVPLTSNPFSGVEAQPIVAPTVPKKRPSRNKKGETDKTEIISESKSAQSDQDLSASERLEPEQSDISESPLSEAVSEATANDTKITTDQEPEESEELTIKNDENDTAHGKDHEKNVDLRDKLSEVAIAELHDVKTENRLSSLEQPILNGDSQIEVRTDVNEKSSDNGFGSGNNELENDTVSIHDSEVSTSENENAESIEKSSGKENISENLTSEENNLKPNESSPESKTADAIENADEEIKTTKEDHKPVDIPSGSVDDITEPEKSESQEEISNIVGVSKNESPDKYASDSSMNQPQVPTTRPKKKGPPPVPKKPSSRIAAFQEMLQKQQMKDMETGMKQATNTDDKQAPRKMNFINDLNNLIALPGMVLPGSIKPNNVNGKGDEQDTAAVKKELSDVRQKRARGPRGRKLPSKVNSVTKVIAKNENYSVQVKPLWSLKMFLRKEITQADETRQKEQVVEGDTVKEEKREPDRISEGDNEEQQSKLEDEVIERDDTDPYEIVEGSDEAEDIRSRSEQVEAESPSLPPLTANQVFASTTSLSDSVVSRNDENGPVLMMEEDLEALVEREMQEQFLDEDKKFTEDLDATEKSHLNTKGGAEESNSHETADKNTEDDSTVEQEESNDM